MCEGSSPDECVSVSHLVIIGRAPQSHSPRGGGVTDTFSILPLVDRNVMIYDPGVCQTKAEGQSAYCNMHM